MGDLHKVDNGDAVGGPPLVREGGSKIETIGERELDLVEMERWWDSDEESETKMAVRLFVQLECFFFHQFDRSFKVNQLTGTRTHSHLSIRVNFSWTV